MSDSRSTADIDADVQSHPHLMARVVFDVALHQHRLEAPKSYEGYEDMHPEVEILVDAILRDNPEITERLLRMTILDALTNIHMTDDVYDISSANDLLAQELFDLLPLHVQRFVKTVENFREGLYHYEFGVTGAVVGLRIEHVRVADGPMQPKIQREELKALSTR